MNVVSIIRDLEAEGVLFDVGLNDQEFEAIEKLYDLKFPPDLRAFLAMGLPISHSFYNWRDLSEKNLADTKHMLERPLLGILFDIEENNFWWDNWGPRPKQVDEAKEICRIEFAKAPKLVPILSHRYIPSEPFEEGNPVFSIHQTDIIYYGCDLSDYFSHEFHLESFQKSPSPLKEIRFWSDLVDLNNE